ncbi:MAG TPA: phosphate signaling complex protein PhoU [Pyrinomonadaceae bacterium]|nr:phosphate signaling complex protein PhoU [Pyrinomonadaceae bacterium]
MAIDRASEQSISSGKSDAGPPTGRPIDSKLDLLRDKILLLGGKTEESVREATRALIDRDSELALKVVDDDKIIDQMELEIDHLSIEILGSERPAEHDLRLVVSVAKITPILERIADHAASIAKAALILNNEPQFSSYVDLSYMAEIASEMLRTALDAFTAEDSITSRTVIRRDKKIDECYRHVFGDLIKKMIDDPGAATGAAHLLFVAKHLERIGDYVKDICELNVYLREAVFIKHGPKD